MLIKMMMLSYTIHIVPIVILSFLLLDDVEAFGPFCGSLKNNNPRRVSNNRQKFSSINERSSETTGDVLSTRIYFDIGLGGSETIGRLVFNLNGSDQMLPIHTENLIKLSTGEMMGLDPRLGYNNCRFKHSPQFVEGYPQYRWAHIVDGKGRNAVGRPTERISDPESLRSCAHSMYGGVYYGLEYSDELGDYGVVLTIPLVGAYRGSTGFSIVRVGESPQEWRERLLLNSAVLGYLESGIEVLQQMARQTDGPPTIVSSGKM